MKLQNKDIFINTILTLVGWETSVHVWLEAMFGYMLCLETLNDNIKNIKVCIDMDVEM